MTDNEIIKAMFYCRDDSCSINCPFFNKKLDCASLMSKYALDLINHQKAEIERLEKQLELANADKVIAETHEKSAKEMFVDVTQQIKTAKSEAIKEFAERLKNEALKHKIFPLDSCVDIDDINNLVKEMTEVQDEND